VVIQIAFISNLYQTAKERNLIAGVIMSDVIAFICFVIAPFGIIYPGDLQMLIGSVIGTRFALKYRKKNEYVILLGISVGLGGTILAGISFSLFIWIIAVMQQVGGFSYLFLTIFPNIIVAVIIGGSIGLLIGFYYFKKKETLKSELLIDEEFYESLK